MFKRLLAAAVLSVGLVPTSAPAQGADIPFVNDIVLNVGQSVVFYGYIGDCGVVPTTVRRRNCAPGRCRSARWVRGSRVAAAGGRRRSRPSSPPPRA
jgi:hypothetical protein